jgi:F0F1-type ATP synthase delta subunit
MSETAKKTHSEFGLPMSVASRVDLSRLAREVEQLDNELTSVAVRTKSGSPVKLQQPAVSRQLEEFLQLNDLVLAEMSGQERADLVKQLRLLKDKAPVIHMTFAVTADSVSLQKLVEWLRSSVHPQAVIEIGLQPALVAGAYIRTPNHVHDFSLRAKLKGQHSLLVKELEALRGAK